MLHNEIVSRIIEIIDKNFEHTYFQQDGTSPHYGRNAQLFRRRF